MSMCPVCDEEPDVGGIPDDALQRDRALIRHLGQHLRAGPSEALNLIYRAEREALVRLRQTREHCEAVARFAP